MRLAIIITSVIPNECQSNLIVLFFENLSRESLNISKMS